MRSQYEQTNDSADSRHADVPMAARRPDESNDPIAAEDRQRMGQWLAQFLR